VKGSALSCVAIARLPFRPPTDPVFQARAEEVARRGASPFLALSLPEAILRFKQGFGRLVRARDDRGCVVVLDPRVRPDVSSYGRWFVEALPGPTVVSGPTGEVLRRVEEWLGSG